MKFEKCFNKIKDQFFFSICLLFTTSSALAGPAAVTIYKSTTLLKVDESCDQNFVSTYYAKKNCLLKNDQKQCFRASILSKMNVTGAGLGAFGGTVLDSFLDRNISIKNKFLKVIDQIRLSRAAQREAIQITNSLYRDITKKISNGKFESLSELIVKEYGYPEGSQEREGLKRSRQKITAEYNAKLGELISKMNDPTLKETVIGLKNDQWAKTGRTQIWRVISDVFPKEFETLKPFQLDSNNLSKPSSQYMKVVNSSETLKLIDMLMREGMTSAFDSDYRKPIFEQAKKAISKENFASGARTVGRVVRGAGWGLVISESLSQTGSYVKQSYLNHYLNLCKNRLGLSESETKYLSEYNLFSDQKIIYQGPESINLDCDKIAFNISESAIADTDERFGGIPSGICKMMKKEFDSIDKLFDGENSKIDCSKNDQIKTVSNGPFMVNTFISKGTELSYDSEISWPYSKIGKDKNDGNSDQNFGCTVSPLNSKDENSACIQKQIISCYDKKNRSCSLVSEAVKARVALSITHNLCPYGARSWEGKILEKPSSAAQ